MRKYVFIGIGGILGAICRYLIMGIHIYNYHENVPINTLMINITGSFVMALILTIAFEIWEFDASIRLGIATGFLGAYTTFSTICKETVVLMHDYYYIPAILYIAVSIIIGIAATYLGIVIAREIGSKLIKREKGVF